MEIRKNIRGEVPPFHFFIPMPVNQWRSQTLLNTIDLTEEEPLLPLSLIQSSTLRPRASPSPTRSAPSQRMWSWRNYEGSMLTPYSCVSPQRTTKTGLRTCTPVCCCPRSFELNEQGTGILRGSTRTCKESGASQSGSLI